MRPLSNQSGEHLLPALGRHGRARKSQGGDRAREQDDGPDECGQAAAWDEGRRLTGGGRRPRKGVFPLEVIRRCVQSKRLLDGRVPQTR